MALTQPLPSTYMNGHDPSWDESIVPALRQRLQNESQMLTKRLSSPSIQMSDDYGSPISQSINERRSAAGRRPSAIPRPSMTQERSMTQDRSASGSSQKSGTGGKVPTVKRTRTQSTPYPYDRDSSGATIPAIPDPPESVTPSSPRKADDRSSKIPKASGGLRSDSYGGSGSFNLQTRMNSARRQLPDQRMEVDEPGAIAYSLPYKTRNTQILNEPPPFSPSASSMLSSDLQYEQSRLVGIYPQEAAPRPSTDSVERPFEHWYRGESTRNGGVGELRVGRSEMLDIAQFGHRPQPRANPMSGVVSVSVANAASLFVSRRTGSLDRSRSGERESWFIDDKTREAMGLAALHGKVMDESPLTDLEDADATTDGPESVIGHRGRQRESWRSPGRREDNAAQEQYSNRSASTPPFASMDAIVQQPPPMASSTSMGTAASVVRGNSRKSTKSSKSSKSTTLTTGRRTPTSTKAMPVTSAKSVTPAANGTPSAARSSAVSKVPVITQKAKAKAAAKSKPRPAPKSTPAAASTSELHNLASDSITDDTLVDAIPVFSTPVLKGRNWDDMVLPTVAKKLGLEGYSVQTENGVVTKKDVVQPNKRATLVFPAPGTFGYDHTKVHGNDEAIMNEFGGQQPQPKPQPKPRPQPVSSSPVPSKRSPRPVSTLAFAEYIEKATPPQAPPEPQPPRTRPKGEFPAIVISPPNVKEIINTDKEDGHGGGCCKCVIM